MLGAFKWMRNSAHEAQRLWVETGKLKGLITTVLMDSKADDQDLFFEMQRQRGMLLIRTLFLTFCYYRASKCEWQSS